MDYGIVDAPSPRQLAERVNEMIAEGWTPQGGATYTGAGVCQVVTRDKTEEDEADE